MSIRSVDIVILKHWNLDTLPAILLILLPPDIDMDVIQLPMATSPNAIREAYQLRMRNC